MGGGGEFHTEIIGFSSKDITRCIKLPGIGSRKKETGSFITN